MAQVNDKELIQDDMVFIPYMGALMIGNVR